MKGHSQLVTNFPPALLFRAFPIILQTRSPTTKAFDFVFMLYLWATLLLHAYYCTLALSLSSWSESSFVRMHSSFSWRSVNRLRIVDSPTFTGNIAYVPYVKLYRVSPVAEWGLHLYAHRTFNNSSPHLPLAIPSRFFSLVRMILLAVLLVH